MNILDKIRGLRDFGSSNVIQKEVIQQVVMPELYHDELIEFELRRNRGEDENNIEKDYNRIFRKIDLNQLKIDITDFLLFETNYQKTYLLSITSTLTKFGFFIAILDDKRKDAPRMQWKIPSFNLQDLGLPDKIRIYDSKKNNFGLIDLGSKHKGWYYSKQLHPDKEQLRQKVTELVNKTIYNK